MVDLTKITHDNNRHAYRISMDIAKEGSAVWDLTPYFKGRVGDNRFGLEVSWFYQGKPMNVEGMKPYIEGNVGNYTLDDKKNLQLNSGASVVRYVGDPSDCGPGGNATYYFPEQMFPKEGIFKGYIGLLDDRDNSKNPHISGVTIWFKVLPGIAEMGHACDYYISELEKLLEHFKTTMDNHDKDYQAKLEHALEDIRNKYNLKAQQAEDTLNTVQASIKANQDRQDALTAELKGTQHQIEINNVVTKSEFSKLQADTIKLASENFVQPEAFDSLSDLKNAYPNGKSGIVIVIDTGHYYIWENNIWKDCGEFQAAGIAENSINSTKLTSSLQSSLHPTVKEVPLTLNQGFYSIYSNAKGVNPDDKAVNTVPINVTPYDEYYVNTANYWDGRAVIFLQDTKILKWLPSLSNNNSFIEKVVVPRNANKMIINGTKIYKPRLFKIISYDNLDKTITNTANILSNLKYNFTGIPLQKYSFEGFWNCMNGKISIDGMKDKESHIFYKPIKVVPGEIYRIQGRSAWDARLAIIIDSAGRVIKSFPDNSGVVDSNLSTVLAMPEQAAYLEINEYLKNGVETKVEKAIGIKAEKPLDGKKWCAIGDSWTEIFKNESQSYVNDVAEITGINGINSGAGGTGFVAGGSNNWNFQFYKHQINNDADIYTIFGSFNDMFTENFTFGNIGNTDLNTLAGGILKTIQVIYEKNPGAIIGIVAPGPWGKVNPFSTMKVKDSGSQIIDVTIQNMTTAEFGERYTQMLKDFANKYGLPFLDMYHHSNLRPWDSEFINNWYHGQSANDNTHPNANAMKKFIAPKIAMFIQSII